MFIPCSEKQGSAYFEFSYCKKDWNTKKLLKKGYSFFENDSLLVHIDRQRDFFENYGDYLMNPNSSNGTQHLDPYGVNYYTIEQTFLIIKQIENDKPPYYGTLLPWLQKAVNYYNGFFFLGIWDFKLLLSHFYTILKQSC